MIKVQGALRVKKILQSRNGPFAVGTFSTDIGEFKVKDQVLDQFDEGIYQVSAWIVHVFPAGYYSAGRFIIEVRAQLDDLQVQSEQPGDVSGAENAAALEPDPLDEPPPVQVPVQVQQSAPQPAQAGDRSLDALKARLMEIGKGKPGRKAARTECASASSASVSAPMSAQASFAADDARALFSADLLALIEAKQPVKLDATIDRKLFREQGLALRQQLGYRFNSLEQTFYPATVEPA
ncbi:MAG: DUF3275 family protein [Burkholderiaceae bacterium]|jgi:hypothetical protein|nr:DUF3275 family protein [Burkholderiaceae bacterium]